MRWSRTQPSGIRLPELLRCRSQPTARWPRCVCFVCTHGDLALHHSSAQLEPVPLMSIATHAARVAVRVQIAAFTPIAFSFTLKLANTASSSTLDNVAITAKFGTSVSPPNPYAHARIPQERVHSSRISGRECD
jgi:hypothetical protein